MSFSLTCPSCAATLKAQEKHVGKQLTCPKCQQPFVVSAPQPEVLEPATELASVELASDPLMDMDLGEIDLGDLGIGQTLERAVTAGHGHINPVGYSPVFPPASAANVPQTANSANGLSRNTLALLVAASSGGLLVIVGLILMVVWLFKTPGDPTATQVAETQSIVPVVTGSKNPVNEKAGASNQPPTSPATDSQTPAATIEGESNEPTNGSAHTDAKQGSPPPENREKSWTFESKEVAKVSVKKALADTSADQARRTLPGPIEPPLDIRVLSDTAPGMALQFPEGQFVQMIDVDPGTGDIAVHTQGGNRERYGFWLFLFDATKVQGGSLRANAVLLFERGTDFDFHFKRFGERTGLVVIRDEMLWVLDPHTLRLADLGGGLLNQIDLRHDRYDSLLRPERDPKLTYSKPPDHRLTLYSSSDPDDPTIVLGQGELSQESVRHPGFQLSLASGEMTKSDPMPKPGFKSPTGSMQPVSVPDPYGVLSATTMGVIRDGETVRWPDKRASILPLGILEKRPWIVTRDQIQLHFRNRDDLADQAVVDVPKLLQLPRETSGVVPTALFDDASHDRLVFGGNANPFTHKDNARGIVWVLPLSTAKIPSRPLLVVQLKMPESLAPGQELSVPIELPDKSTKVMLAEGPKGARIRDGKLEWNPTLADFGKHKLVLRASSGKYQADYVFPYTVAFSEAPLPFGEVEGTDLSLSGEYVLAWKNQPQKSYNEYDDPQISLVNVRDRSVVVTRKMKHPIARARLAADRAFLLLRSGFTLEVCGLADLEPIETLHFTEPIADIDVLQDRFLFLKSQRPGSSSVSDALGEFHALELPDLRQTQLTAILSGAPSYTRVSQTTNGWLVGPAVLDDSLKKIRSLHSLSWADLFIAAGEFAGGNDALGTKVVSPPKRTPQPGRASKNETSIPVGDGSVTLTATSLEMHREAANRLPLVQLNVSFTSSKPGWKPVEIPLAIYNQTYEGHSLRAEGQGVLVTGNRRLYTFFPSDFGVKLPAPERSTGLNVRARKPVSLLSSRQTTTVPFEADGGKPPYTFQVSTLFRSMKSGILPADGRRETGTEELVKVTSSGSVSVSGPGIMEALTAEAPRGLANSLYAFAQRRGTYPSATGFVDEYIQDVSKQLQPALGKPLRDFPVGVPILITVTDSNKEEVQLRHELVLELPRQQIIDWLQGPWSRDPSLRQKDPLAQLGIKSAEHSHAVIVPPPDLPLIWNDGTPSSLANELRRLWPPPSLEDPQWSLERLAACAVIMASERDIEARQPRGGAALPLKTWRTTDGKEEKGALIAANEREILVQVQTNHFDRRIPLPLLDNESVQTAWIGLQRFRRQPEYPVRKVYWGPRVIPAISTPTREPHRIGAAISHFYRHYGCLPPRAIVDPSGTRLLSWRVTLLPYLGYSKLFHLFRLNEPWDSEHNQKLIPYMPLIYNATQAGLPLGRTTFKALAGPQTAFPDSLLRRYYEFEDDLMALPLIVETEKSLAVEWTKPDDITYTEDKKWREQLFKITTAGESHFHGIFGDGQFWRFHFEDDESK